MRFRKAAMVLAGSFVVLAWAAAGKGAGAPEASNEPALPPVGASASQPASAASSPSARRQLSLEALLAALDKTAALYAKAGNSVARADALEQGRSLAAEQLGSCLLVVEYEVADLRSVSEGVVDVLVKAIKNAPYVLRKDAAMTVQTAPALRVRMTPEQARPVRPGDILRMTAVPEFRPSRWTAPPPGTAAQQVLTLTMKGSSEVLGAIVTAEYTCSLRGQVLVGEPPRTPGGAVRPVSGPSGRPVQPAPPPEDD